MITEADGTPGERLAKAESLRARAAAAGVWFRWYLVALGIVSAVEIALLETVFSQGFASGLVIGGWAAIVVLAGWWAERHAVFPVRANWYSVGAIAVWFGLYSVLVGPLVRWQFGTALLPWALASFGLSLPFFIAAVLVKKRP
ncbi:hypothetical protein MOQ72_38000 [Saccharopolyspora sp. K220]|uniref:hypothetical protein n=1 Tax=Saccharopolyspora soli TaxID=2926618 RepID=UPI001F5A0749|nr:hypothetical protein [Saccharopolyspora soli]MCI2423229.1 hypothetical protein [Saccharopolyspora soli]